MIRHMLDDDLYKFTMQQAVLELYPDATATYTFTNRGKQNFVGKFPYDFRKVLRNEVDKMADLKMTPAEMNYIREIYFFKPWYANFLASYRYNPAEVVINLSGGANNLDILIKGRWYSTILWEVKLLATISELYFSDIDTDWSMWKQLERIRAKAENLFAGGCQYADFGTRRRRSFAVQQILLEELTRLAKAGKTSFIGTSNVHFARRFGVKAIGTMAHEWIMAHSVLGGLRNANRFALDAWTKVYRGNLGIALTDTYGSDAFFKDFDTFLAKLFDGVRHDSGDPFAFIGKVIQHYCALGIDPTTKTIVFSDSLNPYSANCIAAACRGKIRCSFGIGTNFTNDFDVPGRAKSPALNMVIKMRSLNNSPVVKLSDDPSKATGDSDAIRVANWTFKNAPLGGHGVGGFGQIS